MTRRSGLRARSAGREVPVERVVTAVLAEALHQRGLYPDERDLTLLDDLLHELATTPQVALAELVDMATGCVELVAELLDDLEELAPCGRPEVPRGHHLDPLEVLRKLEEIRGRRR